MISDFAQETLDIARSLTAHHVEINPIETSADETALHVGDDCQVFVNPWSHTITLEVKNRWFGFNSVESAIRAADAYETTMLTIGQASKISMAQKVPA